MASFRFARVVAAACVAVTALACPVHASVTVQITPGTLTVAPNSDFDVKLRVTATGSAFNAFSAVLVYDPSMITPVQLSPLRTQLDSLVTNACGTGSTFHKFRYGGGLDSIDVSMLCNGVSVTGPGPIYHLRFHAGAITGRTGISFGPGLKFANAGVLVNPVMATGAIIGIGVPVLDVPGEPGNGGALRLSAAPNPSQGEARIAFSRPLERPGVIRVHDAQGRLVRESAVPGGATGWAWDGLSAAGKSAAPGLYLAELRTGETRRFVRLVRVR